MPNRENKKIIGVAEMTIDRDEAVEVLWELANSDKVPEKVSEKLTDILSRIEDERYGWHTWGADEEEVNKLRANNRYDVDITRHEKEYLEIDRKYTYKPSEWDKGRIDSYAEGYGE